LQEQKVEISSFFSFISKVSKLQEEIHLKMRNSLKILEHQDKQLEKESILVTFMSNFPNLFEECLKEQKRRFVFSSIIYKQIENFQKMICIEKEKKAQFLKEILLNGMEYYPKNFFPDLVTEDDTIEIYAANIKSFLEKQIFEETKGSGNSHKLFCSDFFFLKKKK